MITKVSLVNWRSHLQSELDFCEGTNCLIGRMGSGKSSVLDGVCFGLFGTFPQLQQKKIKLEDMIMKKPKAQRFAEVNVEFASNGDNYSVKRRIEKGKSAGAEFRKNGKLVEMQSQKVTEEVEKVLKIDYDLFTRAVYSEQNQLDIFLTIPKGQRMKKIDELLRLDRFEAARVSAVSLKNRFSVHKEEKESVLESIKENEAKTESESLKADIDMLKKEHESLHMEAEKAREEKEILKGKIADLEKTKDEIRAVSEKILLLGKLNEQLDSDIISLRKQLDKGHAESDIILLKDKIGALKGRIDSAAVEIKRARNDLLSKRLEIGAEKESLLQLMKIKGEKERLEAVLQENRAEKIKSELREVSSKIEEKAIGIGSLKMEIAGCEFANVLKNKCLVCGHELSEEKKRELILESKKKSETLSAKKADAESLMKALVEKRKSIEKIASELDIAEMRRIEIGNPEADIEGARQKMEKLSGNAENLEREIQNMEKSATFFQFELEKLLPEYESAKASVIKKAEMEKKRKAVEVNLAEIEVHNAKLSQISKLFSAEKLDDFKAMLENLIGAEKTIEAKTRFMDEIILEKGKRLESAEARKKMADECRLEIRKAAAMEEQLHLLERGLEISQEQLRKDFIGAINHAMGMLWENLYPYTDFSSARIAVDGDYVLQIQDSNGWVSVDNVSGGERSIACLTLRMAFALVLAPQLRWLVLDEPTHNLDEKAVAELANVLHDNIIEFVEQAFLITHDPSLEAAVSGYLYRMEKEKEGFTNVIKVEEK